MSKLAETKIQHIKSASEDLWLSDEAGLYFRIRKGGSRDWVIRQTRHGKAQVITPGGYPKTNPKQAARYQMKED